MTRKEVERVSRNLAEQIEEMGQSSKLYDMETEDIYQCIEELEKTYNMDCYFDTNEDRIKLI